MRVELAAQTFHLSQVISSPLSRKVKSPETPFGGLGKIEH
jgi:hypothetical protein